MVWISPAQRYVFTAYARFIPQNLWVGVSWYRCRHTLDVTLCLLPMLSIKITLVDLIDPTPHTPHPNPHTRGLTMLILSIIIALVVGFAAAACIMAPELADHEACKPAPQGGESWKAGRLQQGEALNGESRKSGEEADRMYELMEETRHHIDITA
jgi:hypothetical protein